MTELWCRNGKLARLVFAICGAAFLAMSPSCWSALPQEMRRPALMPWVKFFPESSVCECSPLASPSSQTDVYIFAGIMAALIAIPMFFLVAIPWINRKLRCTAFSQDGFGLRIHLRPKDEEAERKKLLKKQRKQERKERKKNKKNKKKEGKQKDDGTVESGVVEGNEIVSDDEQGDLEEEHGEYESGGEEEREDGSFDSYEYDDSTTGAKIRARIAEDKLREESRIEMLDNKFTMFNKQREYFLRIKEEEAMEMNKARGVLEWKRGTPDKVVPAVKILATRCATRLTIETEEITNLTSSFMTEYLLCLLLHGVLSGSYGLLAGATTGTALLVLSRGLPILWQSSSTTFLELSTI